MKKLLLSALTTGMVGMMYSQVLWQDNFESYPVGDFLGNSDWVRDGGDTNWVKIVELDPSKGKSMQMNTTETNDSGIFVTHQNHWDTRSSGNNIIVADFDYYTGIQLEGMQIVVVGTEDFDIIMELGWNMQANNLYISGDNIDEILLDNPTPDTWYHFTATYNTETGEIKAKVNNGAVISGTTSSGKAPAIFDFSSFMSSEMGINNILVKATNQDVLATQNHLISTAQTKVFPNPAKEVVHIKSTKEIASTTLLDMSGKVLSTSQNKNEVNVGNLNAGQYLLQLKFKDGTSETQKIIKK